MKLLFVSRLTALLTLLFTIAGQAAPVYVQAGPGSFNHAALDLLESRHDDAYHRLYSGTPENTYAAAVTETAWAFSALANSTINGQLVPAIVKAMRNYKVTELSAAVRMPIEMCVFGVDQASPITHVASHPAALKQIGQWLNTHQLQTIPVPKGTNEAARLLAQGLFEHGTVAVGSCALNSVYPELTLREVGIQDNADNHTLFALMKMETRPEQISEDEARSALAQVVNQANVLVKTRTDSAQVLFSHINRRLAQMQSVALFKAHKQRSIEDLSREAVVLSKAQEQARQQCLDTASVEAFFQAQMDAAKAIQYRYRAQWLAEGVPDKDADLVQLRNTLNQLGAAILEVLTHHLAQHGNLTPELGPMFNAELVTANLSKHDKRKLYEALQNVRRIENCQATN
ncbi:MULTISPECIES: gamma subclass chorismate mutase AroQ [unclassified Pseudoalteromonas]|uniref:gamma subclass chorismate mutase AroQ n=1 Tax=unclassified Pseudoalteromonas TaxID=194690 RepID=UPI002098357F|nr:gamma subclass chorismate mutase AroQ [Pseudoalteromonas sp. XMcav2-N]MCO7188895.1 gamma subclass chorismate mutase AroQ [Pseudoalteromonas sp. XMcav2-N]